MKNECTHISCIRLCIVPACLLFFILLLSDTAISNIEPEEISLGAVCFDAIIELNSFTSNSFRHSHTLIFARYWVAPNYYCIALVWAEPQSTDLCFAVHPLTLLVVSDKQNFNIHHEVYTMYNQTYKKPLGDRGVFRYMFGDYAIPNIRFAEQEALATRIYSDDLGSLNDFDKTSGEVLDVSIQANRNRQTREVTNLKVYTDDGRLCSMELFNEKKQLLKYISYEYETKGSKTILHNQTAVLPERPMMVGFRGKGVKIKLNDKEYICRDLQALHHQGGRRCFVEYEPVMLDEKEVPLPSHVSVTSGQDKIILRSAHLMNFKQVDLDVVGAKKAASQFSGFSAEHRKFREFISMYEQKDPIEVEQADVESIKKFRKQLEKDVSIRYISAGELLKHLNILMELNRILGDEEEMERYYRLYLSTLVENKLSEMTLVGGYGVIETTMFRSRCEVASKLLNIWVNAVLDMNDAESVLLFAKRQLDKQRFWTTIKLLEGFSSRYQSHLNARFEGALIKCKALDELCKLLRTDDIAKKGLFAEVQVRWVASIGRNNLEKMLTNSLDQALRYFASLSDPTESQRTFKVQLDKIEEQIGVEKK